MCLTKPLGTIFITKEEVEYSLFLIGVCAKLQALTKNKKTMARHRQGSYYCVPNLEQTTARMEWTQFPFLSFPENCAYYLYLLEYWWNHSA